MYISDATSTPLIFPSFLMVHCPKGNNTATAMCIDVIFADGSHDLIMMSARSKDAPTVLQGTLKHNKQSKAVVILKDEFQPTTTVSKISNF